MSPKARNLGEGGRTIRTGIRIRGQIPESTAVTLWRAPKLVLSHSAAMYLPRASVSSAVSKSPSLLAFSGFQSRRRDIGVWLSLQSEQMWGVG